MDINRLNRGNEIKSFEVINKLVDKKASEDNKINLHTYEQGIRDAIQELININEDENLGLAGVPYGGLIFSPHSDFSRCKELFVEWVKGVFNEDIIVIKNEKNG